MENLDSINGELLADIVSRLDGSALASFGSTSSHLRHIARDHNLWKNLCHSTWPSTAHHVIPSFRQLFADSFPFIFYDEAAPVHHDCIPIHDTSASPCDFVSLVDVFYKDQCVFSTVLHGIPEAADAFQPSSKIISDDRWKWFLGCPFKLQLLHLTYDEDEDDDEEFGFPDNGTTPINTAETSAPLATELMQAFELSWILLDKKAGKAVNLSTRKPFSVHSIWPLQGEYVVQFGSVIPVEETVLPQKLARCKITTKFKVMQMQGCLQWSEISMCFEDIRGALTDGRKSLMILRTALYSLRTTNLLKVENGFNQYEKRKKQMKRRQELGESVANGIYIFIQVAVFAILCNALIHLF